MCTLVLLRSCIESLPYLCILLLPFIGSFYGTDTLLQLSLIAFIQCILVELFSRILGAFSLFFQIVVFAAIMLIPASWAPWYIVSVFKYMLLLSEPLLTIMDAVQGVMIASIVTRLIGRFMDDSDESDAWKWKIVSLIFFLGYLGSYYLMVKVALGDDVILNWIARATIMMLVIIHVCMYHSEQGTLSDIAIVSIYCMMLLYMVKTDKSLASITSDSESTQAPYYMFFQTVFTKHLAKLYAGSAFIHHLASPSVIAMCVIRVRSLYTFVSTITDYFISKDEWDGLMAEEDELPMPITLDLPTKLVLIAMVTQVMIQYYTEPSFYSWPALVFPDTISPARCTQIVTLLGYCVYSLYTPE